MKTKGRALSYNYAPIIPFIIPPILQPLPTTPALVLDLFENDEPFTARGKRAWDTVEQSSSSNEYEQDLKRETKDLQIYYHVDKI